MCQLDSLLNADHCTDWHLELPEEPLLVVRDGAAAVPTQMTQYRMLVVLYELSDVPATISEPADSFSLQFSLLGSETNMGIILASPTTYIRKLRVFHFFTPEESAKNFLESQRFVTAELRSTALENQLVSTAHIPLKQFTSGAVGQAIEFYQLWSGPKMASCSLHAAIGIEKGRLVNMSDINVPVKTFGNVWIPDGHYTTCDPLPDEWFAAIPSRQAQRQFDITRTSIPVFVLSPARSSGGDSSALFLDNTIDNQSPSDTQLWIVTVQVHSVHNIPETSMQVAHIEYELFGRKVTVTGSVISQQSTFVYDSEERFVLRATLSNLTQYFSEQPPLVMTIFNNKVTVISNDSFVLIGLRMILVPRVYLYRLW